MLKHFQTNQVYQKIGSPYGDIEAYKIIAIGRNVVAAENMATNKPFAVCRDDIEDFKNHFKLRLTT